MTIFYDLVVCFIYLYNSCQQYYSLIYLIVGYYFFLLIYLFRLETINKMYI